MQLGWQEERAEVSLPHSIPWEAIAPHEDQALENHCGQSLEDLARRAGLDCSEVFLVINGLPLFRHGIPDEELRDLGFDLLARLRLDAEAVAR